MGLGVGEADGIATTMLRAIQTEADDKPIGFVNQGTAPQRSGLLKAILPDALKNEEANSPRVFPKKAFHDFKKSDFRKDNVYLGKAEEKEDAIDKRPPSLRDIVLGPSFVSSSGSTQTSKQSKSTFAQSPPREGDSTHVLHSTVLYTQSIQHQGQVSQASGLHPPDTIRHDVPQELPDIQSTRVVESPGGLVSTVNENSPSLSRDDSSENALRLNVPQADRQGRSDSSGVQLVRNTVEDDPTGPVEGDLEALDTAVVKEQAVPSTAEAIEAAPKPRKSEPEYLNTTTATSSTVISSTSISLDVQEVKNSSSAPVNLSSSRLDAVHLAESTVVDADSPRLNADNLTGSPRLDADPLADSLDSDILAVDANPLRLDAEIRSVPQSTPINLFAGRSSVDNPSVKPELLDDASLSVSTLKVSESLPVSTQASSESFPVSTKSPDVDNEVTVNTVATNNNVPQDDIVRDEPVTELGSQSVNDDYDYSDLLDYGDGEDDYQTEGRRLAGLSDSEEEYLADEEYYEYNYEDGTIKIPFNYSGLQFTALSETPRAWDARVAFLEQVGMRLYMFVPAIIGGVLLGVIFWLFTIFIIRTYGVVKKKIVGESAPSSVPRDGVQLKKLDKSRIPVEGCALPAVPYSPHSSFRPTGRCLRPQDIPEPDYGHENFGYTPTELRGTDIIVHEPEPVIPTADEAITPTADRLSVGSATSSSSGIGNSDKGSLDSSQSKNVIVDSNGSEIVLVDSNDSENVLVDSTESNAAHDCGSKTFKSQSSFNLRSGSEKGMDKRRKSD